MRLSSHLLQAFTLFLVLAVASSGLLLAQPPQQRPPQVTSPELASDGRITFRLLAPKAQAVNLGGSDIPGLGQAGAPMTKNAEGIWELTVGPLEPGAYRYHFLLDGVNVLDPRNPVTSESNENSWSLVHVPGEAFMDAAQGPHGLVSELHYHSTSLNRLRRAHVYTPPGYESGAGKFPVFYLLHGAFDSDDAWSTVGRAGFILDNLINSGQAKPMVVVMPDGHTGPFQFGMPLPMDDFLEDFNRDLRPLVEKTFRVHTDQPNRAIAGLSMGGAHTLSIAIPNLQDFAYIGVFSSGIFGMRGGPGAGPGPTFEEQHQAVLQNAALRNGLKLFWFGTGKDDFLLQISRNTVEMFRKHGFEVVYEETDGAHVWKVWRLYLRDFAPRLFR